MSFYPLKPKPHNYGPNYVEGWFPGFLYSVEGLFVSLDLGYYLVFGESCVDYPVPSCSDFSDRVCVVHLG